MAPATENAILPLKPDIDITTGDAAKTWRSTLDTILAQPGLQRIAWGQWRENPHNLQMLIGNKNPVPQPPTSPTQGYLSTLSH